MERILELIRPLSMRISAKGLHVTVEACRENLIEICSRLKNAGFEQLIDLCAVDYLDWGKGSTPEKSSKEKWDRDRFAVVYHFLSVSMNQRLRLRVFVPEDDLMVDSVIDIWPVANWYEREAFDLFGVMFKGHDDLRRLLTDYGFVGHPLRKDFPLSGHVEMRYSEEQKRVVYEPVSIDPRVLGPRTIHQ